MKEETPRRFNFTRDWIERRQRHNVARRLASKQRRTDQEKAKERELQDTIEGSTILYTAVRRIISDGTLNQSNLSMVNIFPHRKLGGSLERIEMTKEFSQRVNEVGFSRYFSEKAMLAFLGALIVLPLAKLESPNFDAKDSLLPTEFIGVGVQRTVFRYEGKNRRQRVGINFELTSLPR